MPWNTRVCLLLGFVSVIVFSALNIGYTVIYMNRHSEFRSFEYLAEAIETDTIRVGKTTLTKSENPIHLLMTKYILNTPSCKIAKTEVMPAFFQENWRQDLIPDCSYEIRLGEVDNKLVLKLFKEYKNQYCCIYEILRVTGDYGEDSIFKLSDCKKVNSQVKTGNIEMYLLQCNNSLNFEANLPIHRSVRKKLKYWKQRLKSQPDSRPISVMLLGIDAVSRSHAYRSLPKTLNYLKELGFHDFQAYHSVATSTLTNYMAFLMGLKRTEVRETCTSSWTSPFDKCPLIWKKFSEQKYVTMYVEDKPHTFNWGDQSGFRDKPTDYYIHALFNAIAWIRKKNGTNKAHDFCTSEETGPQFISRYTRRFASKFKNTPFFSLTWFTEPFHSKPYTLGSIDNDLYALFQFFKSETAIFRTTLILLFSDHGLREWAKNFYRTNPIESYIERALPMFFIHVPDRLQEMYPEIDFDEILKRNSKQLTSPFDLHHTLLHLLKLTKLLNDSEFQLSRSDRSSLFVKIPESDLRKCKSLNIFPHVCACNVTAGGESFDNPFNLGRIAKSMENKLRNYVQVANYSSVCADWIVKTGDIISANMVTKEANSTDLLIIFSAKPGNAKFQATIRVMHSQFSFDQFKIVGDLSRINLYGSGGSCVGNATDQDKELKALCICNSEVVKSTNEF